MVEFGTGYYHPMDRDYGASTPEDVSTSDVGVGVKDVGMSLGLGPVPNVAAIHAKFHTGAKSFELGFMGAGKGSERGHTPEYYGKLQRQALEEISRANQVDFTTHATVGIMGLAGMDQHGNFSKANKKFSLDEIRRAIEFAADVARGGNVVVHTGEFQRPLSESEWNKKGAFSGKFESFKEEPELATFRVVDDRTGAVISEARKKREVARPVWNVAKPRQEYFDLEKNKRVCREGERVYLDYEGNQVKPEERMPEYDSDPNSPNYGRFKTKLWEWRDFEKEAEELTSRAKDFWSRHKGEPEEKWKETLWYRFKDAKSEEEVKIRPEEAYIIGTLETNAANSRGWSYYYGAGFDEDVEKIKKLRKAKEFYKKLEDATSEEEKWKLQKMRRSFVDPAMDELIPPEAKFPSELIEKEIRARDNHMKQAREAATSQWLQAQEAEETMRHVESAETYALREAYEGYAEAGIKAMEESKRLEKAGKLKQPVFVAMENIFPESYGAHPDELMNLVEGGRKQMAEMLKQRGFTREEADKKAEEHLKGHLDVGHMNMWRKYWKGDPQKAPEENDREFNKWFLTKVEEMAKKKIIGSVHLADNYGYQDDHLAPGQGNTPVREAVEILKKHGYEGPLIVEPGADYSTDISGFHSLMKTWQLFGSPVYGAGAGVPAGRSRQWQDVQYSYFGQTQPPYFVFGPYSPSEDWVLWSGAPME